MGLRSSILTFESESLRLVPGVTETALFSAIDQIGPDFSEELRYFFDLEIEDDELSITTTGESGKGYDLVEALEGLVALLRTLSADEDLGFRFRFEILGETGDWRLIQSDGRRLWVIPGVVSYPGAPSW